jgi:hypothetical protein
MCRMISVHCEDPAMADIATDLKEKFWLAQLDFLEYWEMKGGLEPDGMTIRDVSTDAENRTFDLFKKLSETVDAIPPQLIDATEELRRSRPERFEKTLMHILRTVDDTFFPANAAEFVDELNRTVQSDLPIPDPPELALLRLVASLKANIGGDRELEHAGSHIQTEDCEK